MGYEVIQADLNRDKEAILKFWNNHHDRKLDSKYQWLYEQNPDGKAMVWLALEIETGEYVGMTTLFPRNILYMNHQRLSSIAGDLFISPAHRSLKAAIMLQRALLATVDAGVASSIYVFPNRQAALVMRRVGYKRIGSMVRMVWILRSLKQLKKRGTNKFIRKIVSPLIDFFLRYRSLIPVLFYRHKLKCINLKKLDQRYDHLWNRCKNQFVISLDKNASYMNWKYASDPKGNSNFFCVIDINGLDMYGCIAFREDEDTIEIRDLILDDNDSVNRVLIHKFLRHVKSLQPESVYASVLDNSSLKDRLQKLGFMQRDKGLDVLYYTSAATSCDMSAMSESRNWLLINNDDDT